MSNVIFTQSQPVRCPSCDKIFNFTVKFTEVDMEKELWVDETCHHCKTDLLIDFEPYLTTETIIHKGVNTGSGNGLALNLPDEILAEKR